MKQRNSIRPLAAFLFVLCAFCAAFGFSGIAVSAADTTAVTFTYKTAGAQENLKRYVINVESDVDLTASTQAAFAVSKNGESLGNRNFDVYRDVGADPTGKTYIIIVPYSAFVADAADSSAIVDTYRITMAADATFENGTHHTAKELSYVFSGASVADASTLQSLSFTHKKAEAQDSAKRYLCTLAPSIDFEGHPSVSMYVSKNGAPAEKKSFTLWREAPATRFFLLNYETLTGDSTVTSKSQISDTYEVTLKQGTLVNNYIVEESVTYIMSEATIVYVPNVAEEYLTPVEFTVDQVNGAQDNLGRYAVTASTDVDLGAGTAVKAVVDGTRDMLIEMYYDNGSIIFLMKYAQIEAGATAAAAIGEHQIVIPAGAQIGSFQFANSLVFGINGSNIVFTDPETLIDRTIDVTAGENGTASAPATARYPEEVVLTVAPDEGYEVSAITINGVAQSLAALVGNKFTFACPKSDVAINVTFARMAVTVALQNVDAELTAITAGDLFYGAEYSFTVAPVEGFRFNNAVVKVNGTAVVADNGIYTVILTAKENVITVEGIEIATFTVTFRDGDECVDTKTVNYNAQVTAPATPVKEGYTFVGWYLGENLYDFDDVVNSDLVLQARYEKNAEIEPGDDDKDDDGGCNSSLFSGLSGGVALIIAAIALTAAAVSLRRRKD